MNEYKYISMTDLRKLGKSDILVSPVGLGCWQFSKQKNMAGKFWPSLDDDIIRQAVSVSISGGINWFDTAEAYGNGESERSLSVALQSEGIKPGEVTIATKWWPMFRFASNIRRSIQTRIRALEPYPIDLYQVHQPWGFSGVESEMEAMLSILERKQIRSIGVSNFSVTQMQKAWKSLNSRGVPLVSNQVVFSLLNRRIESNGVLEKARELGITIIAYSPLAQGLLTGKFHDNPQLLDNIGFRRYNPLFKPGNLEKSKPVIELVKELSTKYNVTPSQVALNWVLNYHGDVVVAIPGATREGHARENTGALTFRLSDEDMEKLDRISAGYK